jgi:putative peptidoglycan binding protein
MEKGKDHGGKIMKAIGYSVVIGSLALALTAGAAQDNKKKPETTRPQHRTASVHAARPASTGAMTGARHSTALNRQQMQRTSRSNSNTAMSQSRLRAVRERNAARNEALRERNFARNQEFRTRRDATVRERNIAVNRTRNFDANRERNVAANRIRNVDINRNHNTNELRARNSVAINRERNVAIDRTRNVEVNRARNADQFRARNGVTVNRERNFNQTRNFAYYRGGNVTINNNFHSAAFRGQRYAVFRNYQRQWHDRGWWRRNYTRIVFVSGGWYYWNAGYWFPAWGYDPYVSYVYDGPIYSYNGLTPDRVVVDVQQQLARDGYYDGPIDGVLGPVTREAIAAFQADNGLSVTSVIDEPTLDSLGLA